MANSNDFTKWNCKNRCGDEDEEILYFDGLEWEMDTPRVGIDMNWGDCGREKVTYTYDQHEARLKSDGWERAPNPQEVFKLFAEYLRVGDVGGPYDKYIYLLNLLIGDISGNPDRSIFYKGVHIKQPEFTSHAIQKEKSKLFIYEYVTGLKWDAEKKEYSIPEHDCWYQSKLEFDLSGLEKKGLSHSYNLNQLIQQQPVLGEYFFGNLIALPSVLINKINFRYDEVKEREAVIFFPKKRGIFPLAFGIEHKEVSLDMGFFSLETLLKFNLSYYSAGSEASSRGVCKSSKNTKVIVG